MQLSEFCNSVEGFISYMYVLTFSMYFRRNAAICAQVFRLSLFALLVENQAM